MVAISTGTHRPSDPERQQSERLIQALSCIDITARAELVAYGESREAAAAMAESIARRLFSEPSRPGQIAIPNGISAEEVTLLLTDAATVYTDLRTATPRRDSMKLCGAFGYEPEIDEQNFADWRVAVQHVVEAYYATRQS